jgi:hypothetical protein
MVLLAYALVTALAAAVLLMAMLGVDDGPVPPSEAEIEAPVSR